MPDELAERVIRVMAATQHVPADTISPEKSFQELNIDSLDGINIVFALEKEFNIDIPDEAARNIKTVSDMIEGVRQLVTAGAA